MTERAWLTSSDPDRMLAQLRGQATDRKLHLFACACCRRVEHVLSDRRSRAALGVIERYADGQASRQELETALDAAALAEAGARGACRSAARAVTAWSTAEHARSAAAQAANNPAQEAKEHADLLREIVGNPYRVPPIDLAWLAWNDRCVERIARAIYDERRFADMPVLADALEEAGCTAEAVLTHCRRHRGHVRGCWLLDALLGVPVVEEPPAVGLACWTIERADERQGQFVRQTSCAGGFARVTLRVLPTDAEQPVSFVNAVGDGMNAQLWLAGVENGIRQVVERQVESGRRLRGIRVALTGFADHPVDSKQHSFEKAASAAFAEALLHARMQPVCANAEK